MPVGRSGWSCTAASSTALVLLMLAASLPTMTADALTVGVFAGDASEVSLGFKGSSTNSTAAIDLPRGSTVTSAQFDIEGIPRRGDDPRSYDYSNYGSTAMLHRAWRGYVQGNYPPSYPYWNPYSPRGTSFSMGDYAPISSSNDQRLSTVTPADFPAEYPFHLFVFKVDDGNVTRLKVEWEGYGYCAANATTRGAEVFLWRNASRAWVKGPWYSKTETLQDRLLTKEWAEGAADYVDSDGQVFVLVYGKRSENTAGPNPTTEAGEIATDYARLNVTYEGDWEYIDGVDISVGTSGVVWSWDGGLTGPVTVTGAALVSALQAGVDVADVAPGNVSIGLGVTVGAKTAAEVRLSGLQVEYTPVVNTAPQWVDFIWVNMTEDIDLPHATDLDILCRDDHNSGALVYTVVTVSTAALEATVADRHWLSVRFMEANWHGTATVTVNATDKFGLWEWSPLIELRVTEVNDAPVLEQPGMLRARQGEPFSWNVTATDVDGDALAFSDDSPMFEVDPATGEIAFVPTNDDVGRSEFNLTVDDGRGGTATVLVAIVVDDVNDPPTIKDPGPLTGRQGDRFTHTFEADDPDLPHGDLLRFFILGDDFYRNNLLLNEITGELEWATVTNADVGVHRFQVQVIDSYGGEVKLDVVLTIENVNDPPTFQRIPDMVVAEDGVLSYSIRYTDADLSVDPTEALTWTVDPPWFQVSASGGFSMTATRSQVGDTPITVTVKDRAGASFAQTFLITVRPVNHAPEFSPVEDQVLTEDVPWSLTIVVTDPDDGDVVVLTGSAPFAIPRDGGTVNWTPLQSNVGDNPVRIEATDRSGAIAILTFTIMVVEVDDPPIVRILAPFDGDEFEHGKTITLRAEGSDEEGARLTYDWYWRFASALPDDWERITNGAEALWTDAKSGTLVLRVVVSDGNHTAPDEIGLKVDSAPGEGGLGTGALAAIVLVLAVAVVGGVLLLRSRMRLRPPAWPEDMPPPQAQARARSAQLEPGPGPFDEWEEFED